MVAEERPFHGEIHMIIEGSSEAATTKRSRHGDRRGNNFHQQSHNDAVVVSLNITDYNVYRVFIDN